MAFVARLWRNATRPEVARRCALIAVAVGTLLTLVNQWGALASGQISAAVLVRAVANYLVPFIVSNLGALPARSSRHDYKLEEW
jgi:hypothetical protein